MQYVRIVIGFLLVLVTQYSCTRPSFEQHSDIAHPAHRDATVHFADPSVRGSAFLLADGQHFITNLHVIFGHLPEIRVSQPGGKMYPASAVAVREDRDLAIFRIEGGVLSVSEESIPACRPEAGLAIYAIGAPYGLPSSLMRGSISHADRTGLDPFYSKLPMIQTQGITYPGMSGAAVYCERGGFLGINRAAYGFGLENGFGMIIPASAVEEVIRDAGLQTVFSRGF